MGRKKTNSTDRVGMMYSRLGQLGIGADDAKQLRNISMVLHRWHELECGVEGGCIERGYKVLEDASHGRERLPREHYVFRHDELGIPYWANHNGAKTTYRRMPDRETGAHKLLSHIFQRYPDLVPYIQGDPRGASLYVVRKADIPAGGSIDAYYTRGVAVYK